MVLPKPAIDADAYTIVVENRSENAVLLSNDLATGETVLLPPTFMGGEASATEAMQNPLTSGSHRMTLLVTPDGVYRVPGYYLFAP